MSFLNLFLDSEYEVRSGWKFLAYSTLLVVLFIVTGTVLGMVVVSLDPRFALMDRTDMRFLGLNAIVLLIPSVLALLVMARYVDRVPITVFGMTRHEGWIRDFFVGLAIAAGLLCMLLAGSFFFGTVRIGWNASADILPLILVTAAVLLLSAFNEELVFRGYPMQVFLKSLGPWGAMLLISFIWALLHARNEGATISSTLNTVIAGLFLGQAYLATRSIWFPFGIHFGWNAGTAILLGMPVSGTPTASLLKTEVTGPEVLLGGGYGPEDGLLGTAIFLAGVLVIRRLGIARVSPTVQTALSAQAGKVYIEET